MVGNFVYSCLHIRVCFCACMFVHARACACLHATVCVCLNIHTGAPVDQGSWGEACQGRLERRAPEGVRRHHWHQGVRGCLPCFRSLSHSLPLSLSLCVRLRVCVCGKNKRMQMRTWRIYATNTHTHTQDMARTQWPSRRSALLLRRCSSTLNVHRLVLYTHTVYTHRLLL